MVFVWKKGSPELWWFKTSFSHSIAIIGYTTRGLKSELFPVPLIHWVPWFLAPRSEPTWPLGPTGLRIVEVDQWTLCLLDITGFNSCTYVYIIYIIYIYIYMRVCVCVSHLNMQYYRYDQYNIIYMHVMTVQACHDDCSSLQTLHIGFLLSCVDGIVW